MGWLGSQYLPLRAARPHFPRTLSSLRAGGVPVAHRFAGVSLQRAGARGATHSDQRNYLLSTLTPLRVPADGACGIVAGGTDV